MSIVVSFEHITNLTLSHRVDNISILRKIKAIYISFFDQNIIFPIKYLLIIFRRFFCLSEFAVFHYSRIKIMIVYMLLLLCGVFR